ncbi:MAG: hypothetical protein R3250_12435 [Melioribacteraceae bacterium]|nr:hypothetical protein [Melioribacteraceae bacterium]
MEPINGINVYHYIVENQKDMKILEAFFLVMFDEIRKVYGAPAELNTYWLKDEDGDNLSTLWMTTTHNTLLMVRVYLMMNRSGWWFWCIRARVRGWNTIKIFILIFINHRYKFF